MPIILKLQMYKNIKYKKLLSDRDTLNYIHDEVTKLEMENWNRYGHRNGYSRGKNLAYREVVQNWDIKNVHMTFKFNNAVQYLISSAISLLI
jgi:hypothetical protein